MAKMKPRLINLHEDILEQADREAKRLGISFADFVRLLLSQYFNGITFERERTEEEETVSAKE